jgi:cytochrome c biogenesis protein CcdA/thiol-disulfide isomerase/thioredoxin
LIQLETGLAFLEGIALIASPCILPVLPLILSTSIDGGKMRPYGIILGFILSFSLFAILAQQIVQALHLNLDLLKQFSLTLLGLFGLMMLMPAFWKKFLPLTQGLANIGSTLSATKKNGFFSGILIGALIGLVWTPCAGPILAAVLVQIIRQETQLDSLFMIAAFSAGAGLPMLILSLLGQKMIVHINVLLKNSDLIRKILGILVLISVAYLATGFDITRPMPTSEVETNQDNQSLIHGIPPYPEPEFAEIEAWLNSKPLTLQSLRGKVVLIDFWTYSCINCIRTLPYVTAWDRKYRDKGLVIIGMHSPEFVFEKSIPNVKSAIAQHHIEYPVALDNRLSTWQNFNNRYWPAHYLIDQTGQVVYTHFGEGDYQITEHNIQFLLGLNNKEYFEPETKQELISLKTPETYLGYLRMKYFSSLTTVNQDVEITYLPPKYLSLHHWALDGKWTINDQRIVSGPGKSTLKLNFFAKKVFLVLGTSNGQPIQIKLILNGEPIDQITVTKHTLYQLVEQAQPANALLEIEVNEPGLEAYAFTFG